jgi:hypothetical protein
MQRDLILPGSLEAAKVDSPKSRHIPLPIGCMNAGRKGLYKPQQ